MNADRYLQIDELVNAALEVGPDDRASFLDEACRGDGKLRQEVEAMLDAYNKAEDLFETPAVEIAARSLAEDSALSLTGKKVGRFEILSLLGTGGMGEVYLADDRQMNRKVALKLLPAHFTKSPDRVARFQRESRAASGLNHPNIITIFEIGQERGIHFITSEYIEGDTLRQKIADGRLTLKESLEIAVQTASALAAAHEAGIIHRDIKPENVMVRPDGYVKVLDFGLAKLTEPTQSDADQSVLNLSTQSGMVLGTINYMSPEQALGRETDNRSDIFSLGIVLYEMVTGKQPFKGQTAASTFDAILHKAPAPVTGSGADHSTELEPVINRALEKDRDLRYQTAIDFRAALKGLHRNLDSRPVGLPETGPRSNGAAVSNQVSRWWKWAAVALAVTSVVSLAGLLFTRGLAERKEPDWLDASATKISLTAGLEQFPSLSPDGKSLIYASQLSGDWDIYLKRVGSKKAINLTEDSKETDTQPAFSSDGTRIAFRSGRSGGGIFVMTETGESVRQVTDFGFNPAWSPDGKQIVCSEVFTDSFGRDQVPGRLYIVEVETGESRVLTEGDAVNPSWSPGDKRIAYWGVEKGGQRDIWTIPARGGEAVKLTNDAFIDWNPVWSPDGQFIYFVSNRKGTMNIWRVGVDEASGKASGEPELVPTPAITSQHISFSRDGKQLAYVEYGNKQNAHKLGFDPAAEGITGQPALVTHESGEIFVPNVSPDGQSIVYQTGWIQKDILALKVGTHVPQQLTDDAFNDVYPVWSPDGKKIAFTSNRSGNMEIWTMNPDGSAKQQITDIEGPQGAEGDVVARWQADGLQPLRRAEFYNRPEQTVQRADPRRDYFRPRPGAVFQRI